MLRLLVTSANNSGPLLAGAWIPQVECAALPCVSVLDLYLPACRTDVGVGRVAVPQPMLAVFLTGDASASVESTVAQSYSFKGHTPNAEDVANAIAFLASAQAAAVSGVNLLVDAAIMTGLGGRPPEGAIARGPR